MVFLTPLVYYLIIACLNFILKKRDVSKSQPDILEHAKCPKHSRKLATKTAFTCFYRDFFEKVLMVFLTPLVYHLSIAF